MMRTVCHRDAEEMMLVEAIKASLQEAALNGLLDVTPQGSQELPDIPSQGAGKSPGTTMIIKTQVPSSA